jgi:hypothetical protein
VPVDPLLPLLAVWLDEPVLLALEMLPDDPLPDELVLEVPVAAG